MIIARPFSGTEGVKKRPELSGRYMAGGGSGQIGLFQPPVRAQRISFMKAMKSSATEVCRASRLL